MVTKKDIEPTIISLNDIIEILKKKNPLWKDDEFRINIFIWQSSLFLESHVKEVCEQSCPEFLTYCLEYRNHGTIDGRSLSPVFSIQALDYILRSDPLPTQEFDKFGCSPVRSTYWMEVEKQR